MIEFDYVCNKCTTFKTNHELECFACECGGTYQIADKVIFERAQFEPHYNEVIKDWVHSWKDMEDKGKKFRSKDHPNGFVITNGNTKFMREMKYINKHKEEYIQQQYAKDGYKYKPGSKVHFNEEKRTFINSNRPNR